jgi:hypothetical protein
MSTFKTTSGDYTVNLGPYDTGNSKWGGTMNVNGNLNVAGNITYVTDIAVNDAFIIVAANNTGTVTDMGMVAKKNSSTYAGLRFDTTANAWQVSSSVNFDGSPLTAYANINTGGGAAFVAGTNTQVQFNDGGTFGATANLTFNKTLNQLSVLSGSHVLGNVGSTPSSVANSVIIYNKALGAGDTGLYVVSSTADDELTAYKKAKLLSIIF